MKNAQQNIHIPIHVIGADSGKTTCITSSSVALPKGAVWSVAQCTILQNGNKIDSVISTLGTWADNSLRWIRIESFSENTKSPLDLVISSGSKDKFDRQSHWQQLPLNQLNKHDCGTYQLLLGGNNHIICIQENEKALLTLDAKDVELLDSTDSILSFVPNELWSQTININDDSNVGKLQVQCLGNIGGSAIAVSLCIDFYPIVGLFSANIQLHNPNRAIHENGHWDLGDANAFLFKSFTLGVTVFADDFHKISTIGEDWRELDEHASIVQFASGGNNWRSPVHLDRHNRVPMARNGFEYISASESLSGERANPCLLFAKHIQIGFPHFWQNFPKAIRISSNKVAYDLFPELQEHQHELQAGEKKKHQLWVDLKSAVKQPSNKLPIANGLAKTEWMTQANGLSFAQSTSAKRIGQLIENGINSENDFFTKRELLDEFGWRNFGELYADHETAHHSGNEIFVSHYNNQYDPIWGFLRQYIRTQNSDWLTLADELAKHVKDIDIYDTKLDKDEYNQGLFWHTDHYLAAFTSTHRSYSKFHQQGAYEDHAGGGGPGGQHCYTTGLTWHYWLTGEQSSKQTVINLMRWITNLYEGQNTCLELLLAAKNRHIPGYKNQFNGQYPLDRGIANYLNALFDCFDLTQDRSYIERCEHIIQNTVHPNDDINSRNLNDVEHSWFYTVFLQALYRYLDVKSARKELDDKFYYARDTLLHYADWMLENEYPYLNKPDILEYPNDTWTAQDLRKACVFAAAWYYDAKHNAIYLKKAKEFETYVADKLIDSAEKTYTRVLALLMLNDGVVGYYQKKTPISNLSVVKTSWQPANYQLQNTFASGFVLEFMKRLSKLSIKKEIAWLKSRLN